MFLIGIWFVMTSIIGTCIGKIWGRNGESFSRAKEPKQFWFGIASYFFAGVGMIGYYAYLAGAFPPGSCLTRRAAMPPRIVDR